MKRNKISEQHSEPIRLLIFSVSLRTESLNTHLAKPAATIVEKHGAKLTMQI